MSLTRFHTRLEIHVRHSNPIAILLLATTNLFTTSDSPNIRIPILQIFVFVIEGGQENIFLLVEQVKSDVNFVKQRRKRENQKSHEE